MYALLEIRWVVSLYPIYLYALWCMLGCLGEKFLQGSVRKLVWSGAFFGRTTEFHTLPPTSSVSKGMHGFYVKRLRQAINEPLLAVCPSLVVVHALCCFRYSEVVLVV